MLKCSESNVPFGVIFCGGEGKRLAGILPDGVPKSLMNVEGDETMLDIIIRQQRRAGIGEMVVVASEQNADAIRAHSRRRGASFSGVRIVTTGVREKRGLGSILSSMRGELPADRPLYKSDGDALHFHFDPQAFIRFHDAHVHGSTALVTRWGAWKHFAELDSGSRRINATDSDVKSGESAYSLTGTVIIGRDHRRLVEDQLDTKTLLRSLAETGQFFGHHFKGPSINVNTLDDYHAAVLFGVHDHYE